MEKNVMELKKRYFKLMENGDFEEAKKVGKEYADYLENEKSYPFEKDDVIISWDAGYDEGYEEGYDTCWEDNVKELEDENNKLKEKIEQLEKSNYLLKMQNDMNAAENNHLEKILKDVKDRLSYL